MVLTGEGALLAVGLAALVVGLLGAWALVGRAVRRTGGRTARDVGQPKPVRRVIVPAGKAPRA